MDISVALKTVSKAVAGAVVAAVVGLAARYGFNADQTTKDALEVLVTALVSAAVGYMGVYWAPKNKETK